MLSFFQLKTKQVVVVSGQTGCGKTTQVGGWVGGCAALRCTALLCSTLLCSAHDRTSFTIEKDSRSKNRCGHAAVVRCFHITSPPWPPPMPLRRRHRHHRRHHCYPLPPPDPMAVAGWSVGRPLNTSWRTRSRPASATSATSSAHRSGQISSGQVRSGEGAYVECPCGCV